MSATPSTNKHRNRLRLRIARKYALVDQTLVVGGLSLCFTRVADPDLVLDQVAAEADLRDRLNGTPTPGDRLHLPYWAELWDSATGLGEYLAAEHAAGRLKACASVLDLGCGMGLAGTVAAALGARVLFADLEPPALLFARLNSISSRRRVRTRRLDWGVDQLRENFDLIIGSDILYERAQWPALEAFWREHLAEGGEVLLGEPGRQTGDMFIDWIAVRQWRLTVREVAVTTRTRPIRIFVVTRFPS